MGRKLAGHPVKVLLAHGAKKFGQKIVLPQKNYEDWLHLCVACWICLAEERHPESFRAKKACPGLFGFVSVNSF